MSTRRPRVVVVDCTPEDQPRFRDLESDFDVIYHHGVPDAAQLTRRLDGNDAAITIFSYTKFTPAVLTAAAGLRLVVTRTAGYSHIDVDAASSRGIAVANVPNASVLAVAEFAFGALLTLVRKVHLANADVKAGNWRFTEFKGLELAGSTLGIVGLGAIGQRVARLARAFGMKVLACSRRQRPELAAEVGFVQTSLDEVLANSDVVSVHVGLTSETSNLISADRIARMRPGAILINTARGGIVDEQALHAALAEGRLAGACLDVVEHEPPEGVCPLLQLPNVIATPHIAWHTGNTIDRQFEGACLAVKQFFARRPVNIVAS